MRPTTPPRGRVPSPRRFAAVLALVCLAAAPVPVGVRADEPEAAPPSIPRLRTLHFDGASAAARGDLTTQLTTPVPPPWWQPWVLDPPFSEGTLEPDAERLERFYRTLGFFETRVEPTLSWRDDGERADLVFAIDEGEPVKLVDRGIELPEAVLDLHPREHWTDDLPLVIGEIFSLDRYEGAKKELLARLADAGHPLASIEGGADVDVRTREARLTWRVEPGPVVRFGTVRVEGFERADEALVRREITLREGDVYSLDALRETRTGIQELRVFRSVVVRPQPEEAQAGADGDVIWPVEVLLSERPPRSVRVGIGWGTDDRLRGQLGYAQRNWLGDARHLDARLRFSRLERSFSFGVEQPHWLARRQTLRFESRLGQDLTPAFDAERLVSGVRVLRSFGSDWSAQAGYEFSWSSIGDASSTTARLLDDPERRVFLSGLRFGVRRSTVENPLDARQGTSVDLSVAPFLSTLGSDVSFVSTELGARAFQALGPTVLAGRVRLGSLQPLLGSSSDEIPLPERFYAGGGSSVRGFSFWRLGPREADGRAVGAASVFEGSLELRFPIRGPVGGVVFADAGQLDLTPWRWKPADLTVSLGGGLRIGTPLGPIRLDLAFPLNAPEESKTTFFHFSIGQAF